MSEISTESTFEAASTPAGAWKALGELRELHEASTTA
jgi:hypothetical protein